MDLKLYEAFGLPRPTRLSRLKRGTVLLDEALGSFVAAMWRTVIDGFAAYAESECAHHLDPWAHKGIEVVEEAELREKGWLPDPREDRHLDPFAK
jgi:hypothetical protein